MKRALGVGVALAVIAATGLFVLVLVPFLAVISSSAADCDPASLQTQPVEPGTPVAGEVGVATANIPNRTSADGFTSSMQRVLSSSPDFITLNEVSDRPLAVIEAAAPGYSAYRDPNPDTTPGGQQAMGNVVLWRSDTWSRTTGGRIKIVEDDHGFHSGHPFVWDRFATWSTFQRTSDSAVVSVLATHHMTNPKKFPSQHGNPAMSRTEQYALGMDLLLEQITTLQAQGPVLLAGDMNSHASYLDLPWSAAAKMKAAGYDWVDHGVDFIFYPSSQGVAVTGSWTGPMASDHQWLAVRLKMNGAGPASPVVDVPALCACPGVVSSTTVTTVTANIQSTPLMTGKEVRQDVQAAATQAGPQGVVGWQELGPENYRNAVAGLEGWDSFMPAGPAGETAISWRSDVYTQKDSGSVPTYAGAPGVSSAAFLNWVLLEDPSGAQFWVANVHHVSRAWHDRPENRPIWESQNAVVRTTVDELLALSQTGFITGDLNRDKWEDPTLVERGASYAWSPQPTHAYAGAPAEWHDYLVGFGVSWQAAEPFSLHSDHDGVRAAALVAGQTTPEDDATPGIDNMTTQLETAITSGVVHPDGSFTLGQLTLNADQYANAKYITEQAIARGGVEAAVVAITTALAESGLQSDPGSLGGAYGVFQQTPPDWGTQAQVMDVAYATTAFLDALLLIPSWQAIEPWRAAQAVQRSGAGAASDGQDNYGPHVDDATALVQALGGGVVAAAQDDCIDPTDNGQGTGGNFTASSIDHVGPYDRAQLLSRMNAFVAANNTADPDPFFHSIAGDWFHQCQHFAANLSGRAYSGYDTAAIAWSTFVSAGTAHPAAGPDGMSPPVGAWLYYDSGESAGHVAVYLGNNQVASTDTWGDGTVNYGPASDQTNGIWNLEYLGWAAPWGVE